MTTDPVCGMEIDEKKTKYESQYGGQTYAFCSKECKDEFDQTPEEYARSAA
jgi:YHS domain-containing protein